MSETWRRPAIVALSLVSAIGGGAVLAGCSKSSSPKRTPEEAPITIPTTQAKAIAGLINRLCLVSKCTTSRGDAGTFKNVYGQKVEGSQATAEFNGGMQLGDTNQDNPNSQLTINVAEKGHLGYILTFDGDYSSISYTNKNGSNGKNVLFNTVEEANRQSVTTEESTTTYYPTAATGSAPFDVHTVNNSNLANITYQDIVRGAEILVNDMAQGQSFPTLSEVSGWANVGKKV